MAAGISTQNLSNYCLDNFYFLKKMLLNDQQVNTVSDWYKDWKLLLQQVISWL